MGFLLSSNCVRGALAGLVCVCVRGICDSLGGLRLWDDGCDVVPAETLGRGKGSKSRDRPFRLSLLAFSDFSPSPLNDGHTGGHSSRCVEAKPSPA